VLGEVLLLIAIAIGVILVLRARRQLTALAAQIKELRAHAMKPLKYLPMGSVELADELVSSTREVEKAGFTLLGDFIEASPVSTSGMAMRWFVDARGTTFGWMAPFEVKGKREILFVLMSHGLASQTITSRAPKASTLSRPPFVQVQHVELTTKFKDMVVKHREIANLDDESRGFVPIKTFEQLDHELARMRSKVIQWRESQPKDELLDADLRSLLGAQYRRLGSAMRRRLAA
jgi:hypothetical protein